MATTSPAGEQSIGQLIGSIREDVSGLVRGQLDLAKTELKEEAKAGAAGGVLFALAAVLGLIALVLLSIALVIVVNNWGLTRGWSFVVVGGAYVVLAGLLGLIARAQLGRVRGPERAKASAKRTVQVLRHRS